MIDSSLWFLFPVAVAIASTAMMAGIGGAALFAPFFMLVLKLEPLVALGAGLVIEFFGFSSGVIGYWRKRAIDFGIVRQLIVFTVPATVAGVLLGRVIPAQVLQAMLATLLAYLTYQFLLTGKECVPKHPDATGHHAPGERAPLTARNKGGGLMGGLLVGMISAGLGEINEYTFLKRLQLPVATASATSVFLVAMSATIGAAFHAYFVVSQGEIAVFERVISIIVFTVPGVINPRLMGRLIGVLFGVLAVLTLLLVF